MSGGGWVVTNNDIQLHYFVFEVPQNLGFFCQGPLDSTVLVTKVAEITGAHLTAECRLE